MTYCFSSPQSRFGNFWELRNSFCDVSIHHDAGTLRANKIILASVSDFFRTELETKSEIKVPGISGTELQSLLEFIYKGELTVAASDLKRFQQIAHQFSIELNIAADEIQDESSGKQVGLLDLQPELLFKILSFLPTSELLTNVAQVSKKFNNLTLNPGVHQHVSVNVSKIESKKSTIYIVEGRINDKFSNAIEFLNWAAFTKSLSITCLSSVHSTCDEYLYAIANHKYLKSIFIDNCIVFSIKCFNYLGQTQLLSKLTGLTMSFFFTESTLKDGKAQNFVQAFDQLKNLRNLRFFGKFISTTNTPLQLPINLLDFAASCPRLERFESDLHFLHKEMENFLQTKKDKLRVLKIKHFPYFFFPENEIAYDEKIFDKISECHKLEKLTIKPKDASFLRKLSSLSKLTALRINISSNFPSDFKFPANCFVALRALKIKYSPENESSQHEFLRLLADACPNLTHLSLHTDSQVTQLIQNLISKFSNLETLSFHSANSVEVLTGLSHSNLKRIDNKSCLTKVPKKTIEELFRLCPNLQHFRSHREIHARSLAELAIVPKKWEMSLR